MQSRRRCGRHLVLPGETLSEVAEHYRTPLATLANLNGVAPPYRVYAGQVLDIPTVTAQPSPASADAKPRTACIVARELPAREARPQPVQVASLAVDGVALACRRSRRVQRRALAPTPMPRRAVEATQTGGPEVAAAAVGRRIPLAGAGQHHQPLRRQAQRGAQ